MIPVDYMIDMIKCCYFVGNCKLCPFYKAPKFGMIGQCQGPKKVGDALLTWFIKFKADEEAQQLELLAAAEERIREAQQAADPEAPEAADA